MEVKRRKKTQITSSSLSSNTWGRGVGYRGTVSCNDKNEQQDKTGPLKHKAPKGLQMHHLSFSDHSNVALVPKILWLSSFSLLTSKSRSPFPYMNDVYFMKCKSYVGMAAYFGLLNHKSLAFRKMTFILLAYFAQNTHEFTSVLL